MVATETIVPDPKDKSSPDLIVWQPEDDGGNAVIAILAGELDFEPAAESEPEPPLATPTAKKIKIPNQ